MGDIIGLKAGDELEDLLCAREFCFICCRRSPVAERVGVVDILFGSYDAGIEMKDGLPIAGAEVVGPKVGVEEADFTVAGELSVLALWSNVIVLSTCTWPLCWGSECCSVRFRKDDGVAGATSPTPAALRFCLCLLLVFDFSDNFVDEVFRGGGGGIEDEGKGSGDTESEECSLRDPFAFRFKWVIELRFRFMARATGE